jgi:general secretion pathway protein I
MVAVAILAVGLSAVFSAEAGSVRMAQRAHKLGLATLLVRCKMGEIEEDIAKKGLPAIYASGSDKCCKDAEVEGFKCKWEVQPVVLPDTMFADEDDKDKKKPGGASSPSSPLGKAGPLSGPSGLGSGKGAGISAMVGAAAAALGFKKDPNDKSQDPSKDKDPSKDPSKDDKNKILKEDPKDVLSGDPSRFLAGGSGKEVDGITAMAMQFVYPVLKPAFQSQIRRATVTINWDEGNAHQTFDVTQYIVADQPVPLTMDPNNPNQLLGAGTGTGTGTTGLTGSGSLFPGMTR